jgi:cytochrome c peroxidase
VATGVGGKQGNRHAPPLFNLYSNKHFMVDGRAASLESQIALPIESQTELAADWQTIFSRLVTLPETRAALQAEPGRTFNQTFVVKSLAAYLRTLVSGSSAFDRFYYADEQDAIGPQAKKGLLVFLRKARCTGCHTITGDAAPLTDGSFHSIGVGFQNGAYRDPGRFSVTGQVSDLGAFKTPTLRNVAERRHFMHDGSMFSLREVIEYYNKGGSRNAPNLDRRMQPLFLTELEIDAMIEFLKTLSGPIVSYCPPASTEPTAN